MQDVAAICPAFCRGHLTAGHDGFHDTDRLGVYPPHYADGPTARFMTHMFDMRCRENGIEHRLTKIKHPWTNGQEERMN